MQESGRWDGKPGQVWSRTPPTARVILSFCEMILLLGARCYRFTTGNNTYASWGMMTIGGILPGMVNYILHALHGRLNAMDKTDTGRGLF